MSIKICQVTPQDVLYEAVARLRYEVYADEEHQELPDMDHRRGVITDSLDPVSFIFAAVDGDAVIGTFRCTPMSRMPKGDAVRDRLRVFADAVSEARQLVVGRLMVDASHRGGPACALLFAAAYRAALDLGFEFAFAECSPHNVPLYESVGCRQAAPTYFDPDYGLNVTLALIVRDFAYLAKVQSPLAVLAGNSTSNAELAAWFAKTTEQWREPISVRMKDRNAQDALFNDVAATLGPSFIALSDAELRRVMRSATVFGVEAGTQILRAGCASTETFLVIDGDVALARCPEDFAARREARATAGQVFNEQSLLAGVHVVPNCHAHAASATRLLALSAESFGSLRRSHPGLARSVESGLRQIVAARDLGSLAIRSAIEWPIESCRSTSLGGEHAAVAT